jgi:hypothetical protein
MPSLVEVGRTKHNGNNVSTVDLVETMTTAVMARTKAPVDKAMTAATKIMA